MNETKSQPTLKIPKFVYVLLGILLFSIIVYGITQYIGKNELFVEIVNKGIRRLKVIKR